MHFLQFFVLAASLTFGLLLNWHLEWLRHKRRLRNTNLRIHVNGIRGKSTVTRILAGMLRAANYNTVAKTTGSAACVIDSTGVDHSIVRNGAPTILEQVEIIRKMDPAVDTLVVECMAIKPDYQRICEHAIIQSNIGIITNVREDHQDILGDSLDEIALNLMSTCPSRGVLITAEQNPQLLRILRDVAHQKETRLIVADPKQVPDESINRFPYIAFKENVAIGLEVASLLNIDKSQALAGMINAAPDPGVLRVIRRETQNCNLTWADLFAVNDRESVVAAMRRVSRLVHQGTTKVGLLNNRSDREHRAMQFARIAARELDLQFVGLMGAYEQRVEKELVQLGFPADRILRLSSRQKLYGHDLVNKIIELVNSQEILLVGMVNIHTDQADSLRHVFLNEEGG